MRAESTELIEYTTAEQLAAVYRESTAKLSEAILTIGEQCERLRDAFGQDYHYRFDLDIKQSSHSVRCNEEGVAQIIHNMKLEAWSVIIEKLNIRRLMSSKRVEELSAALHGGRGSDEFPDITPENIRQVAAGYAMSATEFLEEAVVEEYDFWRPNKRSHDYVRNSEYKLNRKIIRHWMVERIGWGHGWRCNYQNEKHVTALDSIFHMLDGRGAVKEYKGPLASAIETEKAGQGETDLFRFKCFKNGNLHLEFKRQDLLDLFNQIASKRDRLGQDK